MCKLSDFNETQLRLMQDGICQQIADNNIHMKELEDIFLFTDLCKHQVYVEREKKKEDLYQCATKILEALVSKRVEAMVTSN